MSVSIQWCGNIWQEAHLCFNKIPLFFPTALQITLSRSLPSYPDPQLSLSFFFPSQKKQTSRRAVKLLQSLWPFSFWAQRKHRLVESQAKLLYQKSQQFPCCLCPAVSVQHWTGFTFAVCCHGAKSNSIWTFFRDFQMFQVLVQAHMLLVQVAVDAGGKKTPSLENWLGASEGTDFIMLMWLPLVHLSF